MYTPKRSSRLSSLTTKFQTPMISSGYLNSDTLGKTTISGSELSTTSSTTTTSILVILQDWLSQVLQIDAIELYVVPLLLIMEELLKAQLEQERLKQSKI
jgi:hypothetical protein